MGVRVLSLFDGMACGMLAMLSARVEVDKYYAYEIDKYAVQTATHNFPNIVECGDVFKADFTQYEGYDFLIGGSPCTYWSVAQKSSKRETEASGLGWELFSQYVRALKEVKPRFFIYENNKSMSKAIRESITEAFGFDAICINSALVSAQNRQRLYWVGKRNENGTYSKVDVQQPEDRGILLRNILDGGVDLTSRDKSFACTARYSGTIPEDTISRNRRSMVAERIGDMPKPNGEISKSQGYRIYSLDAKSITVASNSGGIGSNTGLYAIPVNETLGNKAQCVRATCYKDGICNMVGNNVDKRTCVAEAVPDSPKQVGAMPRPNGELSTSQGFRIYDVNAKAVTLKGNAGGAGGKTGLYAVSEPICVASRGVYSDGKRDGSLSGTPTTQRIEMRGDGSKTNALTTVSKDNLIMEPLRYPEATKLTNPHVYEVNGGEIEIKGKKYPIKLLDGKYVIRKLSVNECKRLQTVPEWYEFPVSNSQAYKMLGNGWTVEVIAHLIGSCLKEVKNG